MAASFQDSTQKTNNRYRFDCPVTGRTGQLFLLCGLRSSKQMRGEKLADGDCACAMNAGKCPFRKMQKLEWRTERNVFQSDDDKTHRLHPKIVEEVERICICTIHAQGTTVTADQFNNMALTGLLKLSGAEHKDRVESEDELEVETVPIERDRSVIRQSKPSPAMLPVSDMGELLNQAIQD